MKRSVWITVITIITVCCVIGGTFYHIFRYGAGFFGHGATENTSLELEAFDAINVDANLMNVTITAGNQFYLSCVYSDELEPVYEVKSGTLTIKQRVYSRVGVNNAECSLSLTVPAQKVLDSINVHTALGNIELEGISASECELLSNMGNCTLRKCSFDKSDLKTNLGEISVRDTGLGKAEVDNDMGEINLDACTFGDLSITASMGGVKVDAAQALDGYDMELEADLGSVHVNNRDEGTKYHQSGSDGELEIDTNMGSIRLTY
ncbi:MAG: DUF4097 domain-containing protein [Lachnospiraceae bacterium]|nr:DUF4097 domain-containing protein [Lachnospiraceae bacterium]MDE7272223.1 DUF4097 domain-containing protein [Lachnospiraceae bacterium]